MSETPRMSPADDVAYQKDGLERLRDFSEALQRGDTQAALRRRATRALPRPNRAEAHYAYGQAWMAAGKPARAEQAFAIAVKLRPGFADAWVNYGLARYAQGAVDDAKRAMTRALQARPAIPPRPPISPPCCASPAATRRPRRCCARRWRAIRTTPARGSTSSPTLQEEQPAEALALLNEVDPPADDLPAARHWHLQRALALLALGRPDKARTALGEFDALGPAPPELKPMRLWRDVLIAFAEDRRADAPRRRKQWRSRSKKWGRSRCSNTRSWRTTTSPSSGRARATTPRLSRNGAPATRC